MLSLAQRLEIAMKKRGVKKKADLARACKVSTASVADWFNGKTKQLSADTARLAAKFFGCSRDWIGSGIGEAGWEEAGSNVVNVEPGPPSCGKVPLISWVQAGPWADSCVALEPHEVERWLDCSVPHSSCTAALQVRGDSMTAITGASKSYPEGSYIFVDFEKRSPVNGQRIVANIDVDGRHEVTFKVFKDEDGRKWLQALNPAHEPIRDPFRVLGTVIGKWEDE